MSYVRSREHEKAVLLSEVAREARAKVDTGVLDLDLTDEELLKLCLRAHERDMTLNEFVCYLLEEVLLTGDPELTLGEDLEDPATA